jgi:hypothetical protein
MTPARWIALAFFVGLFAVWLGWVVRHMKRPGRCSFSDARRHHGQREADRLRWAATGDLPESTFQEPQWTCPCGRAARSDWFNY